MSRHRLRARRLLMGTALFFSVLMLAACQTDTPYSTIAPEGTHAESIYTLLKPVAAAGLAVFIVVEGLLVYSVVRFRRRSNAMPVQTHGNTRIEILWTIAPALIVLVISVLTFRTQAVNSVMPPDALRINAIGHQWWWEFKYLNEDSVIGNNGVESDEEAEGSPKPATADDRGVDLVTANDMYIPVGRDVTVVLNATDVIHNFWVPRLAGKTYNIPNNTNYITFRAEREGIYRGQCAEFCGEAHALMRFRVIAVAPEVFDRWMAEHQTAPTPPLPGYELPRPAPNATAQAQGTPVPTVAPEPANFNDSAAQGQITFIRKGCITCHVIDGVPQAVGQSGPNLTYFGSRTTIAAGIMPNTPENLAAWLHNPGEIKPGNLMANAIKPGVLSEQEISNLIAYLEGMKVPNVELPPER